MVGLFASFGMNFIDTVMAGRLPDREVALAGMAVGGALWSAMLTMTIGMLMALQPMVAQLDGARLPQRAGEMLRQAFWIALALMVPFTSVLLSGGLLLRALDIDPAIIPTAVEYLGALAWGAPAMCLVLLLRYFSEGAGNTRSTMHIGLLGVALNIPLNWVLMFGHLGMPAMGARGCGLATAIVIWIQLAALVVYIRKHAHFRAFKPFARWDRPESKVIRQLLLIGVPIAMTISIESSMFVGAALMIGRLGTTPAAGHLIAVNFAALLFMVPLGLSSAITTRVGNALGRGDPVAARYAGMIGMLIVVGTQTVSASLMLTFPNEIVALYTSDPAIAAVAVSLMFYAAVFQFPDGIQICSAGALRGYRDTVMPAFYNLVAYWLVGLTLGYHLMFARGMGAAGMWVGMLTGLSVGAVLLFSRLWRRSRRLAEEHHGLT